MARYIDAEKLEHAVFTPHIYDINRDDVIALIAEQPIVDVAEVRHGKWEFINLATNYLEPPIGDMCKCSNCNFKIDVSETFLNIAHIVELKWIWEMMKNDKLRPIAKETRLIEKQREERKEMQNDT